MLVAMPSGEMVDGAHSYVRGGRLASCGGLFKQIPKASPWAKGVHYAGNTGSLIPVLLALSFELRMGGAARGWGVRALQGLGLACTKARETGAKKMDTLNDRFETILRSFYVEAKCTETEIKM